MKAKKDKYASNSSLIPAGTEGAAGLPDKDKAQEFNLLDEPWILVMGMDFKRHEVSLPDVFAHAHEYVGLSGETSQQDAAMLRLLLAVVHSVFAREFDDDDEALDAWQELRDRGQFPMDRVRQYLETYRHRFWLFDTVYPFYQTTDDLTVNHGTFSTAAGISGAIAESGNKQRQFAERLGAPANGLSYAEAARWLVFRQAYDDMAGKKKDKKALEAAAAAGIDVSGTVGWLGSLGLVMVEGRNLFETLLFNACFLRNGSDLWAPVEKRYGACAVWELEDVRTSERCTVPVPENPAALYTIQARRLHLVREGGVVTGYRRVVGDKFLAADAASEQMTVWEKREPKGAAPVNMPRPHDADSAFWHEFPVLFNYKGAGKDTPRPGLFLWLSRCGVTGSNAPIRIRSVSMRYSEKRSSFEDAWSDVVWVNAGLLDDVLWQKRVADETAACMACASNVVNLAVRLVMAAGRHDRGNVGKKADDEAMEIGKMARARFFAKIDRPFRAWVAGINPQTMDDSYVWEIRRTIRDAALGLGDEMAGSSGNAAFRGRVVTNKKTKVTQVYTAVHALSAYRAKVFQTLGFNKSGHDKQQAPEVTAETGMEVSA